jgi:4-diphosphocytidyl-2-C-methyl-D-erythritol kinase
LYGLPKLLRLDIPKEDLLMLASELGMDVPFFLGGSCALGEDRGDRLSEIRPGPVQNVLLVKPPIAISSAWAYQEWKSGLTRPFPNHKIQGVKTCFHWLPTGWEVTRNDLEDVVCRTHPIVGELRQELLEFGADLALMSGSGPTVFGFFRHEYQARQAARMMRKDRVFAILTRTLGANERMF